MSLSFVLETLMGVGVKVVQMSVGYPFCPVNLWFWFDKVSSLPWGSRFNKISRVLALALFGAEVFTLWQWWRVSWEWIWNESSAPTLDLQPWAGQACRCWGHQVRPSRGIIGSGREGEKVCGLWESEAFSQEADWLNCPPAWAHTKSERSWMSQRVLPLPRESRVAQEAHFLSGWNFFHSKSMAERW